MSDPNNNDGNGDPYIPSDPEEEEYASEEERIYFEFLEYINELPLDRNSHFVSNCRNCASITTCEGRTPIPNHPIRTGGPMEPWPLVDNHPMQDERARTGESNVIHGGDRHCRYWRLPIESSQVIRFFDAAMDKLNEPSDQVAVRTRRGEETIESLWDILMNVETMSEAIRLVSLPQSPTGTPWTPRMKQARYQIVAQAIIEELVHLGDFAIDPETKRQFYYNVDEKIVLPFAERDIKELHQQFRSFIVDRYQLFTKLQDIFGWIKSYADNYSKERPIRYNFYATDHPEPVLYVHNRASDIYKLTGDGITLLANGEEELFYCSHQSYPITYIPPDQRESEAPNIRGLCTEETDSVILNCFINRTNYEAGSFLLKKEQFAQAALLFYTLPFRTYLDQRPLTRWVGAAGSGKTFTPSLWFRFILYPKYAPRDVGVLKPDDFLVALANNKYYVMDNIDKNKPYMENTLASVSTGADVARRQLYSTWDEAIVRPNSFLFLTSRNPTFQRPDLADRSLIFHTKRVVDNIPSKELNRPLDTHYNELWSEYIDELNSIVHHLKVNGTSDDTSSHRMADFALLAKSIEDTLDICGKYDVEFDILMKNISKERAAFVFEGDPFLPAIRQVYAAHPNENLTATQLAEAIRDIDSSYDISAIKVGKLIKKFEEPLDKLIGITVSFDRRAKHKVYRLGRIAEEPQPDLEEFLESPSIDPDYSGMSVMDGFVEWVTRRAGQSGEPVPTISARLWLKNTHDVLEDEDIDSVISECLSRGLLYEPRPNQLSPIGN